MKTKGKLLHHTYLLPPILLDIKAMDKGKIEAMATKFSEKFAISMFKKQRKFSRRGLTHLDATPTFENRSETFETPCMYQLFYVPYWKHNNWY